MKKTLLIALSIAVLALLLAGCGQKKAMDDSGNAAAGTVLEGSGEVVGADDTPIGDTDAGTEGDSQIVGGDEDEHGCIGSAGYSWCETKQKCLRVWEEPCETSYDIINPDSSADSAADSGTSDPGVSQEELDQLKKDLDGLNPEDLNAFS